MIEFKTFYGGSVFVNPSAINAIESDPNMPPAHSIITIPGGKVEVSGSPEEVLQAVRDYARLQWDGLPLGNDMTESGRGEPTGFDTR